MLILVVVLCCRQTESTHYIALLQNKKSEINRVQNQLPIARIPAHTLSVGLAGNGRVVVSTGCYSLFTHGDVGYHSIILNEEGHSTYKLEIGRVIFECI